MPSSLADSWRKAGHAVLHGVLEPSVCDSLREHIHVTAAEAAKLGRCDLFGYIQEQDRRFDLKLDLCDPVRNALNQFVERCGPALSEILGRQAWVVDLSAITSYPGAQAQTVHVDTIHGAASCVEADFEYTDDSIELADAEGDVAQMNEIMETNTASIWTALIALQDIDESMGPTHVWPCTNNFLCHAQLLQASEGRDFISVPEADEILGIPHTKMTLAKGGLVVYDSRTVHCGGANASDRSRSVLGISFMGSGLKPDGTTWSMVPSLRHKFNLTSFPLPADMVRAPTNTTSSGLVVLPPVPLTVNEGDAEEVPLLPELINPSEELFEKRGGTVDVRDRVVCELEEWYRIAPKQEQPEWLLVDAVGVLVMADLGFKDTDEFEHALGSTFVKFLEALPDIEVKQAEDKCFYKMKKCAIREPTTLTLTITSKEQLVAKVLKKAADATLEIPSLEFEIGSSQEQCLDTLYNHIAKAQHNLDAVGGVGVAALVKQLQQVLECTSGPVTLVLQDPSGLSEIRTTKLE